MDVARRHPIYEHPNHRKNKLKTERRKRKRWSRLVHRSNWRGFSNLSDCLRADRGASHYKNEISFIAGRVDGNRRQDDDTAPRSREESLEIPEIINIWSRAGEGIGSKTIDWSR